MATHSTSAPFAYRAVVQPTAVSVSRQPLLLRRNRRVTSVMRRSVRRTEIRDDVAQPKTRLKASVDGRAGGIDENRRRTVNPVAQHCDGDPFTLPDRLSCRPTCVGVNQVVRAIASRTSSARRAASCSASFLLVPQALGNRRLSMTTHTSKHLLWSGPCSSRASYRGVADRER